MTRKELRDILEEAVGQTQRVDLTEAAWAQGVGLRRRRRAVFAGGGTLVAAAAAVGALVLSGTLPVGEDVAPARPTLTEQPTPTEGPTQIEPGPVDDLAGAHTFIFERAGTRMQIESTTLGVSLDEQPVPSTEDLVDTSWNLVGGIDDSRAGDLINYTIADASTVGVDVPTALHVVDQDGAAILWVDPNGCGGPSYQRDLGLGPDGRFAGQDMASSAIGCPAEEEQAANFWAGAFAGGGWLHQPSDDILLLSIVPPEGVLPDPQEDVPPESTPEPPPPGTAPPTGTASLGGGYGVLVPEGWSDVALSRPAEEPINSTCLLPEGETELFNRYCTAGVEIRTGLTADSDWWWNPAVRDESRAPEPCYAARQDYVDNAIPVTFATEPETGSTTIQGHPVQWFRWPATCEDGQEFTGESWRITDLGIELRSTDGSQDVEQMLDRLILDAGFRTDREVDVQVTEPIGDALSGERQRWEGAHLDTGDMVTFQITDGTRCLITKPGGQAGADLELGVCADLEQELEYYDVLRVIVNDDDEVVTVMSIAMF